MAEFEPEVSYMETTRERVVYYDLLRTFAIFFVMMLHVSAANWRNLDPASFSWQIQNFYDAISRWGVPVFVMISGALFLNREITIETLYKKYILRIIIIYISWSFCYAFIFQLIAKHSIRGFISSTITGHYHMWFLLMIIGLYMITPFLRTIVQDEKHTKYFLILGLLFALAVPEAISAITVFSEKYGLKVQSIINKAHFHFVLGFPVYYVGGYYLSKVTISKKQERYIVLLGILGFLGTIILSSAISIYKRTPITAFYSNQSINVCLEAMLIFLLFKKQFSHKQFSEKSKQIIFALSKYSFGAYLVHIFVITALKKYMHLSNASFNPFFSIPLITLLVFIISYIISAVLNHTPFIKDHFV